MWGSRVQLLLVTHSWFKSRIPLLRDFFILYLELLYGTCSWLRWVNNYTDWRWRSCKVMVWCLVWPSVEGGISSSTALHVEAGSSQQISLRTALLDAGEAGGCTHTCWSWVDPGWGEGNSLVQWSQGWSACMAPCGANGSESWWGSLGGSSYSEKAISGYLGSHCMAAGVTQPWLPGQNRHLGANGPPSLLTWYFEGMVVAKIKLCSYINLYPSSIPGARKMSARVRPSPGDFCRDPST